jgi:hypothetical protein
MLPGRPKAEALGYLEATTTATTTATATATTTRTATTEADPYEMTNKKAKTKTEKAETKYRDSSPSASLRSE